MVQGLNLEGHHKPIWTIPCNSNMRRVSLGFHQLSIYSNLHTIVPVLCPIVSNTGLMSSCTDTDQSLSPALKFDFDFSFFFDPLQSVISNTLNKSCPHLTSLRQRNWA